LETDAEVHKGYTDERIATQQRCYKKISWY